MQIGLPIVRRRVEALLPCRCAAVCTRTEPSSPVLMAIKYGGEESAAANTSPPIALEQFLQVSAMSETSNCSRCPRTRHRATRTESRQNHESDEGAGSTSAIGAPLAILPRVFITLPGIPPPTAPTTAPSRS